MATQTERTVVDAAGVVQGIELPTIYAFAAVVAVAMGTWSFVVARSRPSPTTLHPQAD